MSWAAHPLYETGPFVLHDVGVVVLQSPGLVLATEQYGVLPTVNMDNLKTRRGQKDQTFTAVGYGLQESFPDAASFLDAEHSSSGNSVTSVVASLDFGTCS